jgi:hypothetical protein
MSDIQLLKYYRSMLKWAMITAIPVVLVGIGNIIVSITVTAQNKDDITFMKDDYVPRELFLTYFQLIEERLKFEKENREKNCVQIEKINEDIKNILIQISSTPYRMRGDMIKKDTLTNDTVLR